jgi:hypothetical protein
MKAPAQLASLLQQRTWDKEVALWVGPEAALLNLIGAVPHSTLDLLDLFDEDKLPMDDDETRQQLAASLASRLRAMPTGADHRLVLIVKGIGLLARYGVGLREFYEWFCGDFSMVVLVLDGLVDDTTWPEEVFCDSDRLPTYFQEPLVKNVFGSKG